MDDQWFANEEKVRSQSGVQYVLMITRWETWRNSNIAGITFAKSVKRLYIHTTINNYGAGCLNLPCPNIDPRCGAVVGGDTVFSLGLSSIEHMLWGHMLNKTLRLNGVRHQVVSTLCRLMLLTLMQAGRLSAIARINFAGTVYRNVIVQSTMTQWKSGFRWLMKANHRTCIG